MISIVLGVFWDTLYRTICRHAHVSAFHASSVQLGTCWNVMITVLIHMNLLSPDACGTAQWHQRLQTCAECHGARVLKRPQGKWALHISCRENGLLELSLIGQDYKQYVYNYHVLRMVYLSFRHYILPYLYCIFHLFPWEILGLVLWVIWDSFSVEYFGHVYNHNDYVLYMYCR